MRSGPDPRAVTCSTVELSRTMVRAVGTVEPAVPRERIRRIGVTYDTAARYPFARFLVGFVVLAVGSIGVVVMFFTGLAGASPIGVESGEVTLQLVPSTLWLMVALGFWLLLGVFRGSYRLEIETDQGVRTMFLGNSRDLPDIRQFVRSASWRFGYEIDSSVLDEVEPPP